MKGAIGNALIMNMVITFIILFFSLLIGSIAYSKAFKVNSFLVNNLVDYSETTNNILISSSSKQMEKWDSLVNPYLQRVGYILSSEAGNCKKYKTEGYSILRNNSIGAYDYCIFYRMFEPSSTEQSFVEKKFMYKVVSFVKFDIPVIGNFIKLPISSESKVIEIFK